MERIQVIQDVRRGILPEVFVKSWPKESMLVLWMTDLDSTLRPTAVVFIILFVRVSFKDILDFELGSVDMTLEEESIAVTGYDECKGCKCCRRWMKERDVLLERMDRLEASMNDRTPLNDDL